MTSNAAIKPVLFEQGKYQMVQSDAGQDGSITSYDVINKDTGNIERKEAGFGYARLWVKHLDFIYEKSETSDPDREEEARRNEILESRAKQQDLAFPGIAKKD